MWVFGDWVWGGVLGVVVLFVFGFFGGVLLERGLVLGWGGGVFSNFIN